MYYGYIYKITIPTSNGDRYYYGKHKWNKYPKIDTHFVVIVREKYGVGIIGNILIDKTRGIKGKKYT